jgi:mannose-6-phosphate isomerase class I
VASTYDKHPFVATGFDSSLCLSGWDAIAARIQASVQGANGIICVECYPGTLDEEILAALEQRLRPALVVTVSEAYRSEAELRSMFAQDLTDDPVFGRMSEARIEDFFDRGLRADLALRVTRAAGLVLVVGAGASLLPSSPACLIYADMARWEIQRRQRKDLVGNLGLNNRLDRPGEKYKRAFFLDWRAADRLKQEVLLQCDFVLDTNKENAPKMIAQDVFFSALEQTTQRPFRLVPFFDPGPWGGQWMREKFDLPKDEPNYAWCFDCVPEENSVVFGFGPLRFETPAQNLVLFEPVRLMGKQIFAQFGHDFPIRFDLLDTMGGGNLSLQVHPLTEYIRAHFGMSYTQDESYYLLDAGPDAAVYLGTKHGVTPVEMESDLRRAQEGDFPFPAEKYTNRIPAQKHDHFLIPAGTLHCSGANSMVLEISATPYIFTFKLWDWGRLGLDGRPRPLHIDHGMKNLQWNRDTEWVREQIVNRIELLREEAGWREERTGLHAMEFIETQRNWFREKVEHDTAGTVHVLNLVEGSGVLIESPESRFAPFAIHYAETFVVPAAVGRYMISPVNGGELCTTIRANVRSAPAETGLRVESALSLGV